MSVRVVGLDCTDVRFPTSRALDGSDAMNPDPDYSAAYVVLRTDDESVTGHGFCFTIGRGNEIAVAAIEALRPYLVGRRFGADADVLVTELGALSAELVGDSQLRWLGPEKGVMHMAIAAVLNAAWDLAGKIAGKPVWRLLADFTPEQLLHLVDFRYIADVLDADAAYQILDAARAGRGEREARLLANGYPAYSTSPGWIGYSDAKLATLARRAVADGFTQIKLKVGADPDADVRRCQVARDAVGPGVRIALDANQRWNVPEAITWMRRLTPFEPYWIEEPTSPDDVLGHAAIRAAVAPVKVATGEHVQNRIVFKQLLQAGAIDIVQIDAARVAGVNENIAILLLAAQHGVPVCPHAGGVGLCELVQHLSMFDYLAVSGRVEDRVIEYVDHLHEHFLVPVRVEGGHYRAPLEPGFSAAMRPESLATYRFPDGPAWADLTTPTGRANPTDDSDEADDAQEVPA